MRKKYFITLLILTLVLAACGGQAASAPKGTNGSGGGDGAGEFFAPAEAPAVFEEAMEMDMEMEQFAGEDDALSRTTEQGFAAGERIILKNASLSVSVDDPAASMDAIFRMAEEMGGFVVSSNLYYYEIESGAEVPQASITIRVPAERLDEALAQIEAGSGRVLSKNINGQDVTREYTDLQSRLRNLEEAEAQLQEIMDGAVRTEDVLNVHNQLVFVREQIEVIQGQIQYFEQSAAFSMISIELVADAAVQPLNIGGWQPAGVAKEAVQALINTSQALANAAIWITLYVLPVAVLIFIPLFILWWVGRRLWKRRKQAEPVVQAE